MLEYASILEIFFCMIAAMFPTVIVITAITPNANVQSSCNAIVPIIITRRAAAKPAFLVPAASKAVIVGGAPSYASGNHIWNGTNPILNPNPAMNIPTASNASGIIVGLMCIKPVITSPMFVDPVRPYTKDIP